MSVTRADSGGFRVLHCVTSNALAGIERHVLRLATELRERGCQAEIVCPRSATELRFAAEAAGVPVHHSPYRVLRRAPAVVHVHDGRAALLGSLFASATGARLVRTQHFVLPATETRSGWRRTASVSLHRWLNHRVSSYVGVSRAAVEAAVGRREIDRARAVVISPGIDLPSEDVVAEATKRRREMTTPVVAVVGRLEPERRFDVFLEASAIVHRELPICRFAIAGAGSQEQTLKALAARLGLNDSLEWMGWLADPSTAFMNSHVYVNPTPMEGFGMATAEAMAFGLPVLTTNSGASHELVDPGVSGEVVPPGDPAALALGICSLVRDPARAAEMGERARERAAGYSFERTAERMLDLYRSLPATRGAGGAG